MFSVFINDPLFKMPITEVLLCGKKVKTYLEQWKKCNFRLNEKILKPDAIRVYTARGRLVGVVFFNDNRHPCNTMTVGSLNIVKKLISPGINIINIGCILCYAKIFIDMLSYMCLLCFSQKTIKYVVMETKECIEPVHNMFLKLGFNYKFFNKNNVLYVLNRSNFKQYKKFVKVIAGEKWKKSVEGKHTENASNIKKGKWRKRVTWFMNNETY